MTDTKNQPDQTFLGHPSWEHWTVSLWLNGVEVLYSLAYELVVDHGEEKTADVLAIVLEGWSTPDGAPYSRELIRYAIRNIAD